MKKKPGVMIYFELRGVLKLLSDAEKGKLFEAIWEYGETGLTPTLPDKVLVIWPLIQMRMDTDTDRYNLMGMKRRYAAYVRWSREHGITPSEYNEWLTERGWKDDEGNYDTIVTC